MLNFGGSLRSHANRSPRQLPALSCRRSSRLLLPHSQDQPLLPLFAPSGAGGGADRALRVCNEEEAHSRLRLDRFFWVVSMVRECLGESTFRGGKGLLPVGQGVFKRPPGWHQLAGGSVVAVPLPALSLRSPLQLMPAFRPPQAVARFWRWCFG